LAGGNGSMGAEPENVTTGTSTTVRTTAVTTTTTTLTASVEREPKPVGTGSPGGDGGVGGFFAGFFGRREEPKDENAEGGIEEPTDEKHAAGLHAKLGTALREKQDAYDKGGNGDDWRRRRCLRAWRMSWRLAQAAIGTGRKSLGFQGAVPVAETAVKMDQGKVGKGFLRIQKAQKNLEAAAKVKREAEVAMAGERQGASGEKPTDAQRRMSSTKRRKSSTAVIKASARVETL
jgi:hypothetical protein